MTVNVLMVSSGYDPYAGMTYPIRLALSMKTLPAIKIGILCQTSEDIEGIDIFTYEKIIDRVKVDKKELDNLIKGIGTEWDLIIAGSDSVVEMAHHISVMISKPIIAFFMGFPESRLLYHRYQQHYQSKLEFYQNYIPRTLVPSYLTEERIRTMGFRGITSVVPLGVENFDDIKPMEIFLHEDQKLIVTINRDASHKGLEDFFLLADANPLHKFIWITKQPKTTFLRMMQPKNLSIQKASDEAKLSLLKKADLFMFTSWDEGYLLSCMEAIGCKTRLLVKTSKLAYEVLWKYYKTNTVLFYTGKIESLDLLLMNDGSIVTWLPAVNIMETAFFVFAMAFNDIKSKRMNEVFQKDGIEPSSQQVASLYDTMFHFDDAIIQMKGITSPYHADNWKYHYTSRHIMGDTVIDLGAGRGNTTKKLLDDGYEVVAYDISKKSIVALEKKYLGYVEENKLRVEQFDAMNSTPNSSPSDTVICEELLEHVLVPEVVVDTAIDLALKVAIFTTPIEQAADDPGHLQHFKREHIELLFAKYDDVKIFEVGHPGREKEAPSHFMIVVKK